MKFSKQAFTLHAFIFTFLVNANAIVTTVDSLKARIALANEDTSKVLLYRELARNLCQSSQSEALAYYNSSISLAKDLDYADGVVYGLAGLGKIYSINGEYRMAIAVLDEAIIEAKDSPNLLSLCHSNIAVEYYKLGFKDLFLQHCFKSYKYNYMMQDSLAISYNYNNIGNYYLEDGRSDSATYYLELSLEYVADKQDIIIGYIYDGLASVQKNTNNLDGALDLYKESIRVFKEHESDYDVMEEELAVADIYKLKGDMKMALKYANSAYSYGIALNNYDLRRQSAFLLSELYEQHGRFKKALMYARLEQMFSDSIDRRNKTELLDVLDTKHALAHNKKILLITEETNTKLSKQRSILIGYSILSALLIILLVYVFYQKNKEHKVNLKLVVQLDHANQAITKILGIIGHDLRDSVGNLKNFTQLMHYKLLDNESIDDLIQKFVPMVDSTHNLLENLLQWSFNNKEDFTPSCEDIQVSELFQDVIDHTSHLANTKHINIIKKIDNIRFCGDKNILLTVLRNLLTNAIKFSNLDSDIYITCEEKPQTILFSVADSGVGLSQEQINSILLGNDNKSTTGTKGESGSGLGLYFCSSLIKKHKGFLTVESDLGKGSKFGFEIPKKTKS